MERIQQMPVVLIPVQFNAIRRENLVSGTFVHSIVLRPFVTNDFMTGQNALPGRDLPENVRFFISKANLHNQKTNFFRSSSIA